MVPTGRLYLEEHQRVAPVLEVALELRAREDLRPPGRPPRQHSNPHRAW